MKQIPDVHTLRNVLICRGEGSLGDAIISSCCYRGIKQANPQCKISVVAFGTSYAFLKRIPYIDEIIKLPIRTLIRPHQRWMSLLWEGFKLRKYHFDLVLDSSNKAYYNWRLFKWLAGGERVLDCFTSPVQPFGCPTAHGSMHEQSILKLLGIENPDKSYDLPVSELEKVAVQDFLTEHQMKHYILLNPSGSVVARRFNAEILGQLCRRLERFGCPILIPCAPAMYEHWQAVCSHIPNVQLRKTESVFELFEWVRRAQLVVTPDTSVVHIAAGFKKPTWVFYNRLSVYNAPDNPWAYIVETACEDVNQFNWTEADQQLDLLTPIVQQALLA